MDGTQSLLETWAGRAIETPDLQQKASPDSSIHLIPASWTAPQNCFGEALPEATSYEAALRIRHDSRFHQDP
jgi:hypothetical protein